MAKSRPCRIFMCYRGNTAETANHFRSIMEHDTDDFYGNIWYSSRQYSGRLVRDLPGLISEAEWIIFFIGKSFTGGFIDEMENTNTHCVTAQELIAIERERQKRQREGREDLNMLSINIDDAKLDKTCELDLKHLFSNAKILEDDSVGTYTELLPNVYNSSRDDLVEFVKEHIAPYCAVSTSAECQEMAPTDSGEIDKLEHPISIDKIIELPKAKGLKGDESLNGRDAEKEPIDLEQVLQSITPMPEKKKDKELNVNGNSRILKPLRHRAVLFGTYPQTAEGEERPIEWQVLLRNERYALLISRFALDAKAFHSARKSITWHKSSIRRWLNGEFMSTAFQPEEQCLIQATKVSAGSNRLYNTDPGSKSIDKVFLLSIAEADILLPSEEARRCAPTPYTKHLGVFTKNEYTKDGEPACWWWLRSPGFDYDYATCVTYVGSIDMSGTSINRSALCIRPALWVEWPFVN